MKCMIIFSIRICRIKMNTIVYASEWVYAHLDIAMRFFSYPLCVNIGFTNSKLIEIMFSRTIGIGYEHPSTSTLRV